MKHRGWKLVLGVLGAMLLLVGLLVGDGHRRAASYLEQTRVEVEAARATYIARDTVRPTASLDPVDGNAWDYYGPAVAAIAAIPEELGNLIPEMNLEATQEDTPDDHAIHSLLREYRKPLEQLSEGARRRSAGIREQTLDRRDKIPTSEMMRTWRFLSGVITHEHRMGHDAEAFRVAGVALQLAQDYGRNGTLIAFLIQCVGEGITYITLKHLFSDSTVDPAPLADFVAPLDRLDATRPDFIDCWKEEEIFTKRLVIDSSWDDLLDPGFALGRPGKYVHVRPQWRALFSERITRAQAIATLTEVYRRIEGLRRFPAWERASAGEVLVKEYLKDGPESSLGNPILDAVWPMVPRPFHRDATTQLQRTLLRVGIAIARYDADQGRLPGRLEDLVPRYLPRVPVCPLTGLPLFYKDGKVWSVGANLIDDGGVEDPSESDDGGKSGDAVWSVRPRK